MPEIIHVPERGAILVPARILGDADEFARTMEVEHQGRHWRVVPDCLSSVRFLAKRGIDAPGPILKDYPFKWSKNLPAFKEQKLTADFLCRNPRAFVFNEIGTGKTLSALWAYDYLRMHGTPGRLLIVSTLSTLWRVWADEIFKSFPHLSFNILHGSRQRRQKLLAEEKDCYIINHDGVQVLLEELRARSDISQVIVDEGAEFRNARTDKYAALSAVAGPNSNKDLWWLTGSPMPQAPTDIWAQARMVNPNLVPKYFTRFRNQVMTQINQFKWVPKKGWEEQVYSMLKPSVRYLRDDCIDIPPCIIESLEVEMTKEQKNAYKQMIDHYVIELAEGKITAANEGVKLGKLLQIACGAIYDGAGITHILDAKPKREAMVRAIYEAGSKIIIFTPFKHSQASLEAYIKKKFSVSIVNGDVSAGKRARIFSDFQDGPLQVLLAHPECMAHGLTLTKAHTILWWAPPPSFRVYEQANGRVTRPGQTVKQTIIHLTCSEVEAKAYKRVAQREKMQGILLDMLKSP